MKYMRRNHVKMTRGSDSQSEYIEEEEQCDDTIEKLRSNSDESDGDAHTLQTPTRVASND